ncbi:unnamed protein product, partial [Scytosiphon promiscuus]
FRRDLSAADWQRSVCFSGGDKSCLMKAEQMCASLAPKSPRHYSFGSTSLDYPCPLVAGGLRLELW